MEKKFYKAQNKLSKKLTKEKRDFGYPSETLIRLMKGNYIEGLDKDYHGKKVLDVGFGWGNNLPFLHSLGLDVYGTEITKEMVSDVRKLMKKGNINCDLKCGTNISIPFKDSYFDYLVLWNVIHYETSEKDINQALNEYFRVLKPGGRFFLQTGTARHFIWKNSKKIGKHLRLVGRADDYRKGKILYYFGTKKYLREFLSRKFDDILIGRCLEDLYVKKFDLFVATGIKAK
ncbi:class I SAM-dependent methyltransferase [Candidatus Margulisiibacteriota bacterium]